MEVSEGAKPVRDGAQTVADAFGAAAEEWGIDCPDLGFTSQADPCRLLGGHGSRSYVTSTGSRKEGFLWLSSVATVMCIAFNMIM